MNFVSWQKIFLFLLGILTVICMYGCYPIHTTKKYSSKLEYYKDANSAFEGKEVKVNLTQPENSFYAENVLIQNDSISLTVSKEWLQKGFPLSLVKSGIYYSKDNNNIIARFVLKNGDSVNVDKFVLTSDSTIFCSVIDVKPIKLPIGMIKNITYKNYWGIPAGIVLGTVVGIVTGAIWYIVRKSSAEEENPGSTGQYSKYYQKNSGYFLGPAIAGLPIGAAAGWGIGGRTTWEFGK